MFPHINPTTTHFINAAKYTFRNYIDHAIIFRARDRICRITNPIPSLLARIELLHRRRIYSVAKFTARLGSVLSGFARCRRCFRVFPGSSRPSNSGLAKWTGSIDERRTTNKFPPPTKVRHAIPRAPQAWPPRNRVSLFDQRNCLGNDSPTDRGDFHRGTRITRKHSYFWVIDNRVTRRGTGKSSR